MFSDWVHLPNGHCSRASSNQQSSCRMAYLAAVTFLQFLDIYFSPWVLLSVSWLSRHLDRLVLLWSRFSCISTLPVYLTHLSRPFTGRTPNVSHRLVSNNVLLCVHLISRCPWLVFSISHLATLFVALLRISHYYIATSSGHSLMTTCVCALVCPPMPRLTCRIMSQLVQNCCHNVLKRYL